MAPFLRAEWRHVAMLNYEVDRSALAALVPRGTELDEWQGEHMHHPPWLVAPAVHAELDCDVGKVYGEEFSQFRPPRPASAFLAEGSEVAVSRGVRVAY